MWGLIDDILIALTPILVAITTTYGAVLVAKVNALQKDSKRLSEEVKTGAGSGISELGCTLDRMSQQITELADGQASILLTVRSLQTRDSAIEHRLDALEHRSTPRTILHGPAPHRFRRKKP